MANDPSASPSRRRETPEEPLTVTQCEAICFFNLFKIFGAISLELVSNLKNDHRIVSPELQE